MSFSVKCERTGLEYSGSSLNTLFAQRRNLLRPSFYRMLRDILRFNREAPALLSDADDNGALTLGQYVSRRGYGAEFVEHYLLPMGAAIWSAPQEQMRAFPARFFIRFFHNHGLLSVHDRPQWRVICGGSDQYVARLTGPYSDRVRLRCPIQSIARRHDCVTVTTSGGIDERFDHVVIATHADQALAMLSDASTAEREILGVFAFRRNEAVLHSDESLLPRRRRAWASWNYHLAAGDGGAAVTYLLNRLQNIQARRQFCVTLNRSSAVAASQTVQRFVYHHPVYSASAVAAQSRHHEISGERRTHYCGAYWGYGFHEDGVNSALAVGRYFDLDLPACKVASTKAQCGTVASIR